jgi:hypothetical protein
MVPSSRTGSSRRHRLPASAVFTSSSMSPSPLLVLFLVFRRVRSVRCTPMGSRCNRDAMAHQRKSIATTGATVRLTIRPAFGGTVLLSSSLLCAHADMLCCMRCGRVWVCCWIGWCCWCDGWLVSVVQSVSANHQRNGFVALQQIHDLYLLPSTASLPILHCQRQTTTSPPRSTSLLLHRSSSSSCSIAVRVLKTTCCPTLSQWSNKHVSLLDNASVDLVAVQHHHAE